MNGDSFFARVIAVFTAPGRAMEGVKENHRWFLASLILLISMALFAGLTAHIAGPEQLEMMRDSKLGQMMSAEDYARQYNESLEPSPAKRLLSGVAAGVGGWAFTVFFAAMLLLASKLSGGTATFAQILGVAFWASVISSVGVLLKLPIVLARDSVVEATLSCAALLPESDPTSGLYVFLSTFTDVFSLWALYVMVVGVMKINDFNGAKASVVVVAPWLLFTGFGFFITMLFM